MWLKRDDFKAINSRFLLVPEIKAPVKDLPYSKYE
jgi:hypothetical protein